MTSANVSVAVEEFHVSPEEVRKNGHHAVASNRLKSRGDPTDEEINAFAATLQEKFSGFRGPVRASIPRF